LSDGKAAVKLSGLAAGKYDLTVGYAGDTRVAGATATATLTVVKASAAIRAKLQPTVINTASTPKMVVTVRSAVAQMPAEGDVTVTVTQGGTTVATVVGTLAGEAATIQLPSLPAGATSISVSYQGSVSVEPASATVAVTVSQR
jgi:hypothetical protein